MAQWLVQWTLYCQRVVEAETKEEAVGKALDLGPDPDGSVISDLELPEAKRLPPDG